jgi:hypothetical protein
MTGSRIDELLDEHVPAFEPRLDGWEDVLARASTTRRRYAALAVAALALLLVPTAFALRERIADLFQGTPAPPAVSTSFEANNKVADMATQKGFGDRFPHADVSRAHGVIEIQTPDGPQDLWAAPNDKGGTCYFVDWANDAPGPDGQQFGFGGCSQSSPPSSDIGWGSIWSYRTLTCSLFMARSTYRPHASTSSWPTARCSRCRSSRITSSVRCRTA